MRFKLISILAFILTLAVVIVADNAPSVSIRALKGLDLSKNDLILEPGQATACLNLDFGKEIGTVRERPGVISYRHGVQDAAAVGGYTGIFGYHGNDGTKRMIATFSYDKDQTAYKTYPYQLLLRSLAFGPRITSGITINYMYYDSKPFWSVYNDVVVIANGKNRPFRYVDDNFNALVSTAPGYPDFVPMVDSTTTDQLLDGDYYYYWRSSVPGDTTSFSPTTEFIGPSYPVHVDSDWVFIHNFPEIGYSIDMVTPGDGELIPDTTKFLFYRTRGNADYTDSIFYIGAKTIDHGGDYHFIDSIPDESLGNANYSYGGSTVHDDRMTPDTTDHDDYRIGVPQWAGTNSFTQVAGISNGSTRGDTTWAATWYTCLWFDSATNMVSDTGRSIRIPVANFLDSSGVDTLPVDTLVRISLPRKNDRQGGYWLLIARMKEDVLKESRSDTLFTVPYPAEYYPYGPPVQGARVSPGWYCRLPNGRIDITHSSRFKRTDGSYWCWGNSFDPRDTIIADTVFGEWRIIDTIKLTDSVYEDILPWGSSFTSKPDLANNKSFPLGQWNYPTQYKNRMFMAEKDFLFFSNPGEPARYFYDNALVIGGNQGDVITGLYATEQILNVWQNDSWWVVDISDAGGVEVVKYLDGIGCIAPGSILGLPGGGFTFLHTTGIYIMTTSLQSLYKESSGNLQKISEPVQDIMDNWTIDDLKQCHAWLDEDYNNLCFSFPNSDTTLVYSLLTGDWCPWDFAFMQTARYDSVYYDEIRPSRRLIGVDGDNSSLLWLSGVYDSLKDSANKPVTHTWTSSPLFATGQFGQIKRYGLWRDSLSSSAISVSFWDEHGDSLTGITDNASRFYKDFDVLTNPSRYFKIKINHSSNSVGLKLKGLDIWYTPVGYGEED